MHHIGLTIERRPTLRQIDYFLESLAKHPEGHIVSAASEQDAEHLARHLKKQGFIGAVAHPGIPPQQRKRAYEDFRAGLIHALVITDCEDDLPNAPFVFILNAHPDFLGRHCRTREVILRISSRATKHLVIHANDVTATLKKAIPNLT